MRDDAAASAKDNAEIKELLLKLMSSQQSMTEVQQLEAEGIHVAERLMEDGQEVLIYACLYGRSDANIQR